MKKLTRDFYIPKNAEAHEYPELKAVAYYYTSGQKPAAICFSGRRQKPDSHYTYRSEERRDQAVQEWLDRLKRKQDYKAQRKAEKNGLSEPAHSAKVLKRHLQAFFPGVKFSVRSQIFSMGCSIDVSYTDGPLLEEVEAIANLFQYGRFDGMQDLSYSVDIHVPGCEGAKYVHVSREHSTTWEAVILPVLQEYFTPVRGEGTKIHDYAPHQVFEAEMHYKCIEPEDIEQLNQERINKVLGTAGKAAPQNSPETSKTTVQVEMPVEDETVASCSNVVSLADYKAKKTQAQEEKDNQTAEEYGEYVNHMVSTFTTSQIERLIQDVYNEDKFTNEQKLIAIRNFLAILAERDQPAAIKIFRSLDLQSLTK